MTGKAAFEKEYSQLDSDVGVYIYLQPKISFFPKRYTSESQLKFALPWHNPIR